MSNVDRQPALGPARIALLTASFALLAGLLETAILAFQQYGLHRIIYRSGHYLWMPAVGAFLCFALVTLLLWIASLRFPSFASLRTASFTLTALAAFSVIMVPRAIHPAAAALLALGVAVGASRAIAAAPQKFERIQRRTLPLLFGVELVLILAATLWPLTNERLRLKGLTKDGSSPNVVFIILDTVRAKSLSLYGYVRSTTPMLEQLGQKGVVFERAIAPAPWTLPAHATMFTGMPAHTLSADRFTALDDAYPTLAEVMSERGYATGGFVANLAYASREFGLNRGFVHWEDYRISIPQILANSSLPRAVFLEGYAGGRNSWLLRVLIGERWFAHTKDAGSINRDVLRWVSRQHDRPFFAFVNYFDAHLPYLPPAPYLGKYGEPNTRTFAARLRTERPGRWLKRGGVKKEAALRDRYEESIAYLDAQVGSLLSSLQRLGVLDNTVVMVASDHGEEFGEHGRYEHDTDVYFTQVHVPLIIVQPKTVPANVRVTQPVSLEDIPATVLDMTASAGAGKLPGRSLTAIWKGTGARDTVAALATLIKARKTQATLVTPSYQYIRFADGHEELYDHVADVAEATDLALTPSGRAALESLRNQLAAKVDDRLRTILKLTASASAAASTQTAR